MWFAFRQKHTPAATLPTTSSNVDDIDVMSAIFAD